jgi:peptide/nickel transport system permease protein
VTPDTPAARPRQHGILAHAGALGIAPWIAILCLVLVVTVAILAPLIAPHDPTLLAPRGACGRPRASSPSARTSTAATCSRASSTGAACPCHRRRRAPRQRLVGLAIGLVSGFFRWLDAVVMRIMDGLMAIPSILLAIAIVSLSGASLTTVLVAIIIPEIPRVVRLVRAVVLSAREEPYVEAAISVGTRPAQDPVAPHHAQHLRAADRAGHLRLRLRDPHEAILSFLGAGIRPEIPTWGNIMAEGRTYFQLKPSLIFWPGLLLSITILSVNLLGDAARDTLDPRLNRGGRT